ncbi:MAG: urease accessory protein UreE [Pseudolabrys sp.]|jgi:urease accessory protein
MPRATKVIAAYDGRGLDVVDSVLLDHAQRSGVVQATTVKGKTITVHLADAARLRADDVIALDDGSFVEVVAKPEALVEARAADVAALARIAWHLGDRHIAVQLLPNRIRVLRTEATEQLLKSLGAKVMIIDAPFEPEGGAYEVPSGPAHHDHAHDDHEHHDHAHHGHDHDHAHCGHDHSHDHHGHDHARHGHDHGHKRG